MLGFLKSAGGASAVAVGVTVAAAVWYVFSSVAPPTPATLQTAVTKAVEQTAPNSAEKLSADSPDAIAQKVASAPMTDAASVAKPAPSASGAVVDAKAEAGGPDTTGSLSPSQRPEFDLVRVEPSGDSVIAGRATPGATIALVDGDAVLGRAAADARGEVVFLPPPLAPGEHVLMLQSVQSGDPSVITSRSVAVMVPKKGSDAPLLALAAPTKPTAILPDSSPKPAAAPPASAPAKAAPAVAIRTAEAEEGGSFFATGIAPPGSQSRLYLNGAFLAKVIADLNGLWALKVEKGMRPGSYMVRADEVEPASGKVIARAEVPFIFPAPSPGATVSDQQAKSSAPSPSGDQLQPGVPASSDSVANAAPVLIATVVKEVRTATVVRGDSLWRISRKMLGHGIRYTQIYAANSSQIRNPRLVFPGQIFVMPHDPI